MTVLVVRTFKVKPGRREDFRQLTAEAKRLREEITGAAGKVYWNAVGGPKSGTFMSITEFPDLESYAESQRILNEHPDFQDFARRANAADAPMELLSLEIWSETDLPE